jgi:hypothetical protein
MALVKDFYDLDRASVIFECFGANWFRGKRICKLSVGHNNLVMMLLALGAEVLQTEEQTGVKREADAPDTANSYDLILHLGLLEGRDDWKQSLKNSIDMAPYMVLESEVCESQASESQRLPPGTPGYSPALPGTGSRPSAAVVEQVLDTVGWRYQRIPDVHCAGPCETAAWTAANSGPPDMGVRRFWFCGKD